MSGWLRADRIQGSVYPGFNKGQQAFLWLRFPAADSAAGAAEPAHRALLEGLQELGL